MRGGKEGDGCWEMRWDEMEERREDGKIEVKGGRRWEGQEMMGR